LNAKWIADKYSLAGIEIIGNLVNLTLNHDTVLRNFCIRRLNVIKEKET